MSIFKRKIVDGEHKEVDLSSVITPMLDLSFQILAFFVMTYHPSAEEGHIRGNLLPPENAAIKGEAKKDTTSVPIDPEVKEEVKVIVKTADPGQMVGDRGTGEPTQILLVTPEATEPETIADTNDTLDSGLKKLKNRLDAIKAQRAGPNLVMKLQPDGQLKFGYAVAVWNVMRVAGFENINYVAPTPAK